MFPSGWTAPKLLPRIPEVEPLMAKEGKTLVRDSRDDNRPYGVTVGKDPLWS